MTKYVFALEEGNGMNKKLLGVAHMALDEAPAQSSSL